ncbi:serine hydrolase [Arsenophonus apicola]|uniref:beta-lactamase n=1 Tax=Arsenophonus apicola TaxID=2879119 RepID=A0ABY8P298_9GAMM|nr:serine hydrolase [Arsenophonus apicola]WGO83627.1 serine hydrolase [Arsenophonus apicola]
MGGPTNFTRFLRRIGDSITRLDRFEPELNSAIPGDMRDTTTPVAVSQTLQKLVLGNVLQPSSRQQLRQWMEDDKVANALLRSVLPAKWKIADKTGAGDYGSRSIISLVWPENRQPLIVSIYITQTKATLTQSNEAIARIGKAIFSATDKKN